MMAWQRAGAVARWIRRAVVLLAILTLVVPATIVLVFAIQTRVGHGDLRPWHRVKLEGEFRAGRSTTPKTFDELRQLEDRLFSEVRQRVIDSPSDADGYSLS